VGSASLQASSASRREGEGGGCLADVGRRRRHQGETTEGEKGDATLDLVLKYSDSDARLATYV
jgi:hypothetical protein